MSQKRAYSNNLEYLEDMGEWLRLRMERLCLRRSLGKSSGMASIWRDSDEDTESRSQAEMEACLVKVEKNLERLGAEQKDRIAKALQEEITLPLESIAAEFSLDHFEKMVIILALAPTIDPSVGDMLCRCNGRGNIPEIRDALEILCDTLTEKVKARSYFTSESPLIAHNLVELSRHRRMSDSDFLRMDIEMPRRIAAKLLDEHYIDDQLIAFSNVIEPDIDIGQVVLPDGMLDEITGLISNRDQFLKTRSEWGFDRILPYGKGTVMLFSGPPGTGKTMLAHALAKASGHKLLLIDLPKLLERGEFDEDLRLAFMEARLRHAFIFFDEADELFDYRSGWMPTLLREFEKLDGVAILATNKPYVIEEAMKRRILRQYDFELPAPEMRRRIWKNLIPPEAKTSDDIDFTVLAEQFEFSGGYIKNAVLTALHYALQRKEGEQKITQEDLMAGARGQLQSRMSGHTDKVIPKIQLTDVVLASDTRSKVDKMIRAARHRHIIFSEWGFADKVSTGKAITALFTGPPGVGKSVTAEAIAFELGQVLYPVNIASVLNKYVGETEKNLSAIFGNAKNSDAIIFFDEADAFFNTRLVAEDARTRHLNQQINTLLMEIEKFNGIVILATNLPESIDPAFERRIRYHIDFPAPDLAQREALWRLHLTGKAPLAKDIDPRKLAERYPYSGGIIRNIMLRAAFEAASNGKIITMHHIDDAAGDERPLVEKRRIGFSAQEDRKAQ